MSGNSVLIDTNIALYLLEGNTEAEQMLDGRKVYVSFVTQLELPGFKGISASEKVHVESLLSDCIIIDINDAIKAHTIAIRERHRIKLPDSIIAATALYLGVPLITADRGFRSIQGLSLVLFEE